MTRKDLGVQHTFARYADRRALVVLAAHQWHAQVFAGELRPAINISALVRPRSEHPQIASLARHHIAARLPDGHAGGALKGEDGDFGHADLIGALGKGNFVHLGGRGAGDRRERT